MRRLFKPDKWTPLFACLSTVAGRTSGRRHWPIRCKGRRKDFSSCSLAIVAHAAWRRSMAGMSVRRAAVFLNLPDRYLWRLRGPADMSQALYGLPPPTNAIRFDVRVGSIASV